MPNYPTPLRYPGGKRKIKDKIIQIMEVNNLNNCTYIEPFAGGAGLALLLLFKGYVSNLILNDIDESIYAFWDSVLNHTEELCRLIYDTPVTIDEWIKQKSVQHDKDNQTNLDLGFSTFFLNRTNRSGIITGGIIGGWDQNSKYKIDCRFNKKPLIDRVRKVSNYSQYIKIYNDDAINLIKNTVNNIEKAFIFIDPPYYNKGSELYENHYQHNDHVNLEKTVSEYIQNPWIATYDNVEAIKEIYSNYRQKPYSLSYTAANKYSGTEVMIFSNDLIIPEDALCRA